MKLMAKINQGTSDFSDRTVFCAKCITEKQLISKDEYNGFAQLHEYFTFIPHKTVTGTQLVICYAFTDEILFASFSAEIKYGIF